MLTLRIVTPDGIIYDDAGVSKITIPTTTGEIAVLPHHIPLLSMLASGELTIFKNDEAVNVLAVSGGTVEVRKNSEVIVLADTAERAEHIDIERAQAARQRAVDLLAEQKSDEDESFAALQASIERETARIRVGRKYRKLPPLT